MFENVELDVANSAWDEPPIEPLSDPIDNDLPSFFCPRCKNAPETMLHMLWTCPCNLDLPDKAVTESSSLISTAVKQVHVHQCLCLRGLLPKELGTSTIDPSPVATPMYVGTGPEHEWPATTYFTDCSGGNHGTYPAIRRCGIGIARLGMRNGMPELLWGLMSCLPGEFQTIPRGELFAICFVVCKVKCGPLKIVSDSLVNVKLFNGCRTIALSSTNADLFKQMFDHIDKHEALSVEVIWVPSHFDIAKKSNKMRDKLPFGFIAEYGWGNALADLLADKAAARCQLDVNIVKSVKYHHFLVKRIQARFVIILQNMPPRKKVVKTIVEAVKPDVIDFDIKSAIACSSHSIVVAPDGTSMSCRGCGAKVSSLGNFCKKWLAASCAVPLDISNVLKYQQKQLGNSIQVGNSMTHPSHNICIYRGLFFCKICGARGPSKLVNLSDPCEPAKAGSYGRANLNAIRQGKKPQGLSVWPDVL